MQVTRHYPQDRTRLWWARTQFSWAAGSPGSLIFLVRNYTCVHCTDAITLAHGDRLLHTSQRCDLAGELHHQDNVASVTGMVISLSRSRICISTGNYEIKYLCFQFALQQNRDSSRFQRHVRVCCAFKACETRLNLCAFQPTAYVCFVRYQRDLQRIRISVFDTLSGCLSGIAKQTSSEIGWPNIQ